MKVRGTSDFTVETAMDRAEVQSAMQQVLDRFKQEHPQVLDAIVTVVGEQHELRVQLVLRSDSYGAAEDFMADIARLLTSAVTSDSLTRGATELVPA